MTAASAAAAAYIVAGLLFILSLAGLSRHESSKAGNAFGIAGMAIALPAFAVSCLDRPARLRMNSSPATM